MVPGPQATAGLLEAHHGAPLRAIADLRRWVSEGDIEVLGQMAMRVIAETDGSPVDRVRVEDAQLLLDLGPMYLSFILRDLAEQPDLLWTERRRMLGMDALIIERIRGDMGDEAGPLCDRFESAARSAWQGYVLRSGVLGLQDLTER